MTSDNAIPLTSRNDTLVRDLRGSANGNRESLRRVYDSEAAAMLGVAVRLLRRRDLAEEAVHDAFVLIQRNAGSFDPARGSARSWLFTIVRNRALTILRRENRTELVDDFEPMGLVDEADNPESVMDKLSDQRSLKRCLELLDPERRRIVLLAYVHGLTHGEIAGKLGMPLGTIKSWIRRSLISLRECMP